MVSSRRTRAERAGRSLEAEHGQTLGDAAKERRTELIREINAFRNGLRATCGEMSDSTFLIRESRDKEIG